ncbi:actin cytoskeleton-regulatory complex protein PAN1 isoform X2 [Nematostella vectensis]|uniref:actin cytoskeleton-regulatory complex protein PAN1 isoform X2 n=1 Tax=Nematostella vectensis TaxID=45351 RepID=UPI002077315D|nr:actin cytoskeleton-regulatory complex protein PAN1 isoform X2 [Nematostella vectensis]
MDVDLKWIINEEERTRHDALFYSQNPENGFLSGEQARSLFIRSRLPLAELSKIWKLADVTRDIFLDVSEFATAMHLIQLRLKGFDIPEKLPSTLAPVRVPFVELPTMTIDERKAYQHIFDWKENNQSGSIDTETSCELLALSNLDNTNLSRIWNLSDIDRDVKLSPDEFAIAIHLAHLCRNGYQLEGSIDVMGLLPPEDTKDTEEIQKQRLIVLQEEKRNLFSLKEKLCMQISLGVGEKDVSDNARLELNKVEERLYSIEKKETDLRKILQTLRDKSKREAFKPFDRNYLVKKHISGEDLFKGQKRSFKGNDDGVLFERILRDSKQFVEDSRAVNKSDTESSSRQPQEAAREAASSETASNNSTAHRLVNGQHNGEQSVITRETRVCTESMISSERTLHITPPTSHQNNIKALEDHISPVAAEGRVVQDVEQALQSQDDTLDDSFSWVPSGKREVIVKTVEEEVLVKPKPSAPKPEEPVILFKHESKSSDRVDEKLRQLEIEENEKKDFCSRSVVRPVEEEVIVGVAKTSESSASELDTLFSKLSSEEESSEMNGLNNNESLAHRKGPSPPPTGDQDNYKLPVGRVLSEQEEKNLIESGVLSKEKPAHYYREISKEDKLYIEDMRQKEAERQRVREAEEEKRRQAREELQRREEEIKREMFLRKHALQEVKGKLETQMVLADQDEVPVATSRMEGGTLIERELEEQRKREAEQRRMAQEINTLKEQEKEKERMRISKAMGGKQPTVNIDSGSSVPINRRPQKADAPSRDHRKSWIDLEVERQKEKEEALKQELAQRKHSTQSHHGNTNQKGQSATRSVELEAPVSVKNVAAVHSQPQYSTRQTSNTANSNPEEHRKQSEPIRPVVNREARTEAPASSTGTPRVKGVVESSGVHVKVDEVPSERESDAERRKREENERFRQESLKREADELMQQKRIREEELQRRRQQALQDAEKRKREEEERISLQRQQSESRRFAFQAHKVKLEERVLKSMEDKQVQESRQSRSSSTSSEEPLQVAPNAQRPPNTVAEASTEQVVMREKRRSVRDSLSCFEAPISREAPRDVRKNRFSLNLENTVKSNPDANKIAKTQRSSFCGDGLFAREVQEQQEREQELLRRASAHRVHENKGAREGTPEHASSTAPNVIFIPKGNPPPKDMPQRKDSRSSSFKDHVDGQRAELEDMSEERILREIEELRQKELEIQARRTMLEKMAAPTIASASSLSRKELSDVKKNPVPNKIQMRKAPVINALSKPAAAAAPSRQPGPVQSTPPTSSMEPKPAIKEPAKTAFYRKSFIELEREKELQREEELRKEREAVKQELAAKAQLQRK